MKKILAILIALAAIASTSAQTKQDLKDYRDSVSYSVGVELGKIVQQFDSTLNIDNIAKGIKDAITNKLVMTKDELDSYMMAHLEAMNEKEEQEMRIKNAIYEARAAEIMDSLEKNVKGVKKTESGLLYIISKKGKGETPEYGCEITVHYTLKNIEGEELDSNYQHDEPLTLWNIDGEVVDGFMEGIRMLKKGGKATLYVPPSLGYRGHDIGYLGPYSVLIFELELVDVNNTEQYIEEAEDPDTVYDIVEME